MKQNTTYTLSYLHRCKTPIIKKRPWWAFWKYDKLEWVDQWVRTTHELNANQADIIIEESKNNYEGDLSLLFFKLIQKDAIKNVQLETGQMPTAYIRTTNHLNSG